MHPFVCRKETTARLARQACMLCVNDFVFARAVWGLAAREMRESHSQRESGRMLNGQW